MSAKKKNNGECALSKVPEEVFVDLIIIFAGESKLDLFNFHLVNKRWYRIMQNEFLYRQLCLTKWKKSFVLHLPMSVFSKYDQKFKKMYFMDNKYRFQHYGFSEVKSFRDEADRVKEIRKFDATHGTDVETLALQSICMSEKYKNDFYSSNKFFIEEEDITLTLDMACDPENESEYYALMDGPFFQVFSAFKDLEGDDDDLKKKNERQIDDRFPKIFYIMYMPGGNIHGYYYEEGSKKPILFNLDNGLNLFDYENRKYHCIKDDGSADKETMELSCYKRNIHFFKDMNVLFEYSEEIECLFDEDEPKIRENLLHVRILDCHKMNEDHLEYSNTPVFKLRNHGSKKMMIMHLVDTSGKWSNQGTMGGIVRNFGTSAKDSYERLTEQEFRRQDLNLIENYPKFKIYVCSTVGISCISYRQNGMEKKSRVFDEDRFRNCCLSVVSYCVDTGISELHFDRPKEGTVKHYENDFVVKQLNKIKREGIRVVFHDRNYKN